MATLTVTESTDFRGGLAELNITDIVFDTAALATAEFTPSQFGAGLISNNVEITGDDQANIIQIEYAAQGEFFSAAGWQFQDWNPETDVVLIVGIAGGDDTITGSSQNDLIAGGGGLDDIDGGGGNDTIWAGSVFARRHDPRWRYGVRRRRRPAHAPRPRQRPISGPPISSRWSSCPSASAARPRSSTGIRSAAAGSPGYEARGTSVVDRARRRRRSLRRDLPFTGAPTTRSRSRAPAPLEHAHRLEPGRHHQRKRRLDRHHDGRRRRRHAERRRRRRHVPLPERRRRRSPARRSTAAPAPIPSGSTNAGSIDFSNATITDVETLDFSSGNSTATFGGDQLGSAARSPPCPGSAGVDALVVTAVDQVADLGGVSFTDWTAGIDTITINGSGLRRHLGGSGQNDTINGERRRRRRCRRRRQRHLHRRRLERH